MEPHRRPYPGRGALLLVVAALTAASCTQSDPPTAKKAPPTTAGLQAIACEATTEEPVLLPDTPDQGTLTDALARPDGQLVAIGDVLWVRPVGETTWSSQARPGGPKDEPQAMTEANGEVWVATRDNSTTDAPARMWRSSDLVTWTETPWRLDGHTGDTTLSALAHDGGRWYALSGAANGRTAELVTSSDGQNWTTAKVPLSPPSAPDDNKLMDLEATAAGASAVGFVVGNPIRPFLADWPTDDEPVTEIINNTDLADVRLWGLATRPDGRVLLAVDRIRRNDDGADVGFTAGVLELTADGQFRVVKILPSTDAYYTATNLVVRGDEVVVFGSMGAERSSLVPVTWTVCLAPA
ncbi:MAG: hypothetical protein EXQ71_06965 [Acidimicrobiia bacterium]|nr:hypothetical protein [Acidimicrobiia bacterium]